MSPTARTLAVLALALSGCGVPPQEEQIRHCHENGYTAQTYGGTFYVDCCSYLNGDRVCMRAGSVTKHRKDAWPQ